MKGYIQYANKYSDVLQNRRLDFLGMDPRFKCDPRKTPQKTIKIK
jgi:hypothetical protein